MVEPNSRIVMDIVKDENSEVTGKFHYELLKDSFHGFQRRNRDVLFVIIFLAIVIGLHIYRDSVIAAYHYIRTKRYRIKNDIPNLLKCKKCKKCRDCKFGMCSNEWSTVNSENNAPMSPMSNKYSPERGFRNRGQPSGRTMKQLSMDMSEQPKTAVEDYTKPSDLSLSGNQDDMSREIKNNFFDWFS